MNEQQLIVIPTPQADGYCSALEEMVILRSVYNLLDNEERETLDGKMLLAEIERLEKEIKEIEANIPRVNLSKPIDFKL